MQTKLIKATVKLQKLNGLSVFRAGQIIINFDGGGGDTGLFHFYYHKIYYESSQFNENSPLFTLQRIFGTYEIQAYFLKL
jgi:hypothetical protein